ncbi:hypothetical protein COBT_004030, partial [Conglomerata obtusa]
KSTLGYDATKLITELSQKEEAESNTSESDSKAMPKLSLQLDNKPKKEKSNHLGSKALESLSSQAIISSLDDKKDGDKDKDNEKDQPSFGSNELFMGNSTYQPQIARSLMDNHDKVEIDMDSIKKLDEAYSGLKDNVMKSEGYLADISRIMMGLPRRNDKEDKKEPGSDRLDLKIIE